MKPIIVRQKSHVFPMCFLFFFSNIRPKASRVLGVDIIPRILLSSFANVTFLRSYMSPHKVVFICSKIQPIFQMLLFGPPNKQHQVRVKRYNYSSLGGGFKYFLFSPLFGEDSQFDEYFSNGLKPPASIIRSLTQWLVYDS